VEPAESRPTASPPDEHYLAGLDLAGRRVVIVGGGGAVARRIHRFLRSGAAVTVIAPAVQTAIEALAQQGRITWLARPYQPGDLTDAWYAMAATDDTAVNEQVGAEALERRVFCVRADRGVEGTAVTPAVGRHGRLQVGVLAGGDHRRSGRARDAVVAALREGLADDRAEEPGAGATRGGVALVGGGPGAPDLITVRGAEVLARADVVVVDRLAPGELLEQVRPDCEIVDASKIPYGRAMTQQAINELMAARAAQGKFVVRLKGGDPFVFGRGYEELCALVDAGVATSVVPGVSSAFAAPSLAGIPVTQRGEVHEVVVVSGHLPPGHPDSLTDWDALGRLRGNVIVLMGRRNAAAIGAALLAAGRAPTTSVALVQDASLPDQLRVDLTLAELADGTEAYDLAGPVVIVVGPSARFRSA
jgi:uroporphyrin-III C-methyltransferase/precorrin-2 dehydrogenase/sirohydrochlorin ferrochelatase